MTTLTSVNPLSLVVAGQLASLVSPETRQLISLSRKLGWDSSVLGKASMPDSAVRVGNWLLIPAHQDSSPMPDRALRRIQAIHAAGIRPKGFIVAHEAPMMLPAPESESAPAQSGFLRLPAISPGVRSALKAVAIILSVIALGLVTVASAIAVAVAVFTIAMAMMVPIAMVGTLLLIDPILIVVTEDGYWIEIDRWDV